MNDDYVKTVKAAKQMKYYGERGFCSGVIYRLFQVLMSGVFVAVIFIDKNILTDFPNTVKWDNAGYFVLAVILLLGLHKVYCKVPAIGSKVWGFCIAGIFLATAILQVIISMWFPIIISNDFWAVRDSAVNLAIGGGIGSRVF